MLNLATLTASAQAVASQTTLEAILTQLLRLILEQTTVERAMVVLRGVNGWEISATGQRCPFIVTALTGRTTASAETAPLSLLNQIAQTQTDLLLTNSAQKQRYSDPYLSELSLFCTPLRRQEQVLGGLCLESNAALSFELPQIQLVKFFCSQAELALERLYWQQLVKAVPDLILRVRRDGICTDIVHPQHSQQFQFVPVQQHLSEFLMPEPLAQLLNRIQQVLATDELLVYEHQVQKFGKTAYEEGRITAISADEVLILVRDVSDRKRIEAELRQSEERFRNLVETSSDFVWEVNRQGFYTYASPRCYDILGYTPEEMLGKTAFDLVPDAEATRVTALFADIKAEHRPFQYFETMAVHQDGHLITLESSGMPIFDANGQFCGYRGVDRDITDRKQSEAALQESEQRYRTLVNNIPGAVFRGVHDLEWRIEFLSEGVEQLTGYPASEYIETGMRTIGEQIHPDDRQAAIEQIQDQLRQKQCYEVEYRLITADGTTRWIDEKGQITSKNESRLRIDGIAFDISDRRRLEEEVRLANTQMQAIFDAFPDLLFRADQQGRVLDYRAGRAPDLLYISPEDVLGKRVQSVLPSPVGQNLYQAIQQALSSGEVISVEYTLVIKSVEEHFEARIVPIQADQVVAKVRNISSRKRVELALQQLNQELEQRVEQRTQELLKIQVALQQSEQFLRSIYEGVDYPIFVIDVLEDGSYYHVDCNSACEEVIGQARAEIQGKKLVDIFSELVAAEVIAFVERCLTTGTVISEELCYRSPQEVWYLTGLNPLRDEHDNIYRIIGTAFNITDRKQAEKALQESEERFRQLAENIESVFWMTDIEKTETLYISPACEAMWGLSIEQLYQVICNLGWLELVHPEDRERMRAAVVKQIRGEYDEEYRIIQPNGTIRWLRDRAFPVFNHLNQIYRIAGILEDITERKQAEVELQRANAELESRVEARTVELRQAKEAAEAASRAKSTFLAHMSHELRTPLNAILGFSQFMARDSMLSPEHQQQLGIINRNGEHLLNLINNILEMSKIEAGRLTYNPNTFDLYHLLRSVEEIFYFKAASKNLALNLERADNVPQFIYTDESKLRQVLINLLSNAIKFTVDGFVTLRVYQQSASHLTFEVEDTGLGIDASDLDTLFDPFTQTEAGRKSQEGTGLGLPISREFVQLMQGELTVESVLHQGSVFRFSIQAQAVENPPPPLNQPRIVGLLANQPSYRILVVEDNWANSLLLVELLSSIGFEVQAAQNGQEAVTLWRNWAPDLIWMDIQMPIMDGYQATQQIRAELANRSEQTQTIIIALTASAFEEDRMAILEAGCDDFVPKPVDQNLLLEKIAEHLDVQYAYENLNLPATEPSTAPQNSSEELNFSQLTIMPTAWVSQLHRAALIADEELLLHLIEQIPDSEIELIRALKELVHNFSLDQLIELTQNC